MSRKVFKPGKAFRSSLVEEDVFLFAFHSTIRTEEALFRRFNRVGGFTENEWYRFPEHACFLTRAKEFDFE